LGFGSDLAGSIRIPAAFSGIYSFKPTAFRMSFDGVMGLENNEKFTFREFNWVLGPLGKCVDDLALILNEIYGQFKRDCRNCPLPFNKTQYNEYSNTSKKLKIAYILDDEYCEVCPAVKNCLQEVVKKLEGLGHQMIEFPWKNFKEFIIYGYVHFGAGETLSHKIMRVGKGEYPHKMLLSNTAADKFPSFVKKILIKLMAKMGEKRVSEVLDVFIKAENPNFLDKCSEEKDKMKNKFYKLWLEEDFDAIISPVTPFPAVPLGLGPQLTILFPFTIMYNILEMPSGVVPIRKIRKDEEFYVSKHKDSKTEALKKIMVKSEGLPVAIQVGALPFKDEVALGLMKQIERIFNFHEHPENI